VAALHKRDAAHDFSARLIAGLRRNAIVPSPILVEADHMIRSRIGDFAARRFLKSAAGGSFEVAYLTPGLMRRAIELDTQYADLGLGFADGSVMAIAERHELPILTFDFADFRATESAAGPWHLAVDEHIYQRAVAQ
jgi:predicted nucleic acid-binding protein